MVVLQEVPASSKSMDVLVPGRALCSDAHRLSEAEETVVELLATPMESEHHRSELRFNLISKIVKGLEPVEENVADIKLRMAMVVAKILRDTEMVLCNDRGYDRDRVICQWENLSDLLSAQPREYYAEPVMHHLRNASWLYEFRDDPAVKFEFSSLLALVRRATEQY